MAKDLYQNTKRNRIIGIAALGLLLAACGAPSGRAEETQSAETKEETKEWSEEHDSCEVQELSGYLYEHTSVRVSPYASVEITIKDYEGERLGTA